MTGRWQPGWWARGAFSIVIAYAFLLHLVMAGIATERMAFAAPGAVDMLCVADASGPPGDGGERPSRPALSHCIICSFAKLAPLLPAPATVPERSASVRAAPAVLLRGAVPPRQAWRLPRSSQGPPRTAA